VHGPTLESPGVGEHLDLVVRTGSFGRRQDLVGVIGQKGLGQLPADEVFGMQLQPVVLAVLGVDDDSVAVDQQQMVGECLEDRSHLGVGLNQFL